MTTASQSLLPTSGPSTGWVQYTSGQTNVAYGSSGNDTFSNGSAGALAGGAGDDQYLVNLSTQKIIENAGEGIDTVFAWCNYILPDNVENLYLSGRYGLAGTGNALANLIVGADAADTLTGGKGNDVLSGGGGHDIFAFYSGDGQDTVLDFQATGYSADTLRILGFGLKSFTDISSRMVQVGGDVEITLSSTDKIVLKNVQLGDLDETNFSFNTAGSSYYGSANSDTMIGSTGDDAIRGRLGNDVLTGNGGHDYFGFTKGDGSDTITDFDANGRGSDVIVLNNYGFSSFDQLKWEISQVGNDTLIELTAGEILTLKNVKASDLAAGNFVFDGVKADPTVSGYVLVGTAGADTLTGSASKDTITGGVGDDTLTGGTGADTFVYKIGDGKDVISDFTATGSQADVIALDGSLTTFDQLKSSINQSGSDTIISLESGSIKLSNVKAADLTEKNFVFFTSDIAQNLPESGPVQNIVQYSAGQTAPVYGTDKNDLFASPASSLAGGKGDDTYYVTSGTTVIVEKAGEGVDTVMAWLDYTLPDYVENIVLKGASDANATGNSQANLITGNSMANVLTGGKGNDVLFGGDGHDVFVMNAGDGKDTIQDFQASGYSADTLRLLGYGFTSFSQIQARMTQSGNDVILSLNATDQVVLRDVKLSSLDASNFAFDSSGGWVAGTARADTLTGSFGDDNISGKGGGDTLTGNGGHDNFIFSKGEGNAVITDFDPNGSSSDTIRLSGYGFVSFDDLKPQMSQVGSNAVIALSNGETLTLKGVSIWNLAAENFVFNNVTPDPSLPGAVVNGTSGNDTIVGTVGKDTITGGSGNDTLTGGTGGDTFVYQPGYGNDTITDFTVSGPQADMIKFDVGVTTFANIKKWNLTQSGADTLLSWQGNTITLKNVDKDDLTDDNFYFLVKTDGAYQGYSYNGVSAFNNVWNAGRMVNGVDFTMKGEMNFNNLAQETTFKWTFAQVSSDVKVLAYPGVSFGVFPDLNATTPVNSLSFPVQVSQIAGLTSSFSTTITGDTNQTNVAYDIWFTSKAYGADNKITDEVMVWTHAGSQFPMPFSATYVGDYSEDGVNFKIYHSDTFTALVPDRDVTAGNIDLDAVFTKLESLKILSGTEYLHQIAFGSEIVGGNGSLTIHDFDANMVIKGKGNVLIDRYMTGLGVVTNVTGSAAADVLDVVSGNPTLTGGAGNDTFVYTKGSGSATINDFHVYTSSAAEHDLIEFKGYDSKATLTYLGGEQWKISDASGTDYITLHGVTHLTSNDYIITA